MRRIELALLLAALAIGCDGPRTGDDAGQPSADSGPGADGGPIVAQDGGRDGGEIVDPDGGPTCTDADEDGYGEGCALGPDCDDSSAAISPAAAETCNGVDDNCDGATDEDLSAPSCEHTEGVCAGARARCGGAGGFLACDATDYGADYEEAEVACDGLDNDCDGTTDEGCTCTDGDTQVCGSDVGACMEGTQTCADGAWGACTGAISAMGEVCDGLDNDCDGPVDEPGDLTPPLCPLQLGVCAGSVRTCGGVAGWVACAGIASYGGDYQATESLCDGHDNDCDGVTDEGCTCVDGATQPCGSDVGACMAGTQTCTAGSWGSCAGEIAPAAETCDGIDQTCDGMTDEGVVGPACALTLGVCAGSRQPCNGASGFGACGAAQYGARYQAVESSCDGFDNDCDGTADEGCTCVDGTTQACGESAGVCERGTQTCVAGEWGACTGGVEPAAELCNGLDDDCNGASDDALEAPACALTLGVCAGTTQTCGGASGWAACDASAYGPRYLVSEDGATNEAACDGLDNDCNGTVDDGCLSVPVVNTAADEVYPDLYHRHLVYLQNFDGNWDVVFANLETGETRRLTTTAVNESQPRIYGNHVAFIREDVVTGGAIVPHAILHDLTDSSETELLPGQQANSVDIAGGLVVFDAWNGTSWELYFHDIAMASTDTVFTEPTAANEVLPSLRGHRLAYLSDQTGRALTQVLDLTTGTVTTQTPTSSSMRGQGAPIVDYLVLGWTDNRYVTSTTPLTPMDDLDIFAAVFSASGTLPVYPGETSITGAANAQVLRDVDGATFVWGDYRNGNWDPAFGGFGAETLISTHPATQADPTISGNIILWEDNRSGNYDIYGSALTAATPVEGDLRIIEILADPAADVNGDGTASTTQDEFVEVQNATGIALDISGVTLSDATGVRHTFSEGTVLPALGVVVVFGGGSTGETTLFGGARVQIASSGTLGLNNTGDTITLRAGGTPITQATYSGTIADGEQSIVPDAAGTGWVRHSTIPGSIGAQSPGTSERGFGY